MNKRLESRWDVIVIGGGAAGMCAALSASAHGARTLIIERGGYLGGVLRQCVHNGFGLKMLQKDLTGTEYAGIFAEQIENSVVTVMQQTTALAIGSGPSVITCGAQTGYCELRAGAVVLATGCRERPRGAMLIPGGRPAGVVTAGTAQRLMNLKGAMIGKKPLFLGSGNIGLIMARQFMMAGAQVPAVAEKLPYSSGLMRNIVQCLEDFNIPLLYNTTVARIVGNERLKGVFLTRVDADGQMQSSSEWFVDCDSLILSCGLIPENELAWQAGIPLSKGTGGPEVDDLLRTSMPGVFSCGNCLHVHDIVDYASLEGKRAGEYAAAYALGAGKAFGVPYCQVECGNAIGGIVPHRIVLDGENDVELTLRVKGRFANCVLIARSNGEMVFRQRRSLLTPAEMYAVKLDRRRLGNSVTMEVET